MPGQGKIGVILVDDHPLLRDGLAALIGAQPDLMIAGEAGSVGEALGLVEQVRPDVAVLDLLLPDGDGVELAEKIRKVSPATKVVILSNCAGGHDVRRALAAGAVAYLNKSAARQDILAAIRAVAVGRRYFPLDIAERLAEQMPDTSLTGRELKVLELLTDGMRNKEIAGALGVTEPTIKQHVRNILTKMGVSDRTAAVVLALRRGIFHLSPQ